MPRIRTIKPDLFLHEELAELNPIARLAFIGLFCCVDREGRAADRPKRLKAQILPYDDLDFSQVLDELAAAGFIDRYEVDGVKLIAIPRFLVHQRPRKEEPASVFPASDLSQSATGTSRLGDGDVAVVRTSDAGKGKEYKGKEYKGTEGNEAERIPPAAVVAVWNETVTSPIPQVQKVTASRAALLRKRLIAYPDVGDWQIVITYLNSQAWCRAPGTGKHPQWTATLDWLIRDETTFQKYLEQARTPRPVAVAGGTVTTAARRDYDTAVDYGGDRV